jgi:hypothetical protein
MNGQTSGTSTTKAQRPDPAWVGRRMTLQQAIETHSEQVERLRRAIQSHVNHASSDDHVCFSGCAPDIAARLLDEDA